MNDGYRYTERLDRAVAGLTVLGYLSARYSHSSAELWEERIDAGRVFLDGTPVTGSEPLSAGAVLTWHRPPWVEPPSPSTFAVLYRDDDVLAVAKPRGMPAMPGGGFLERTLLKRVGGYDGAAAPLHRLGRATSGITLFTRNKAARRSLTSAWQRGDVERHYVGLVSGTPRWSEITVDHPIGPVPHARLGTVSAVNPLGKPSRSDVRVVERRASTTLVEIAIATGRAHQIRIHLAALGHPLEGDPLYPPGGVPAPSTTVLPGDGGFFLHSDRVRFPHPSRARSVTITCVPPPTLREELA